MYIKEQDFNYLEKLCESLSDAERKRFLNSILKTATGKAALPAEKIKVVNEELLNTRAIDSKEYITRTAIKKAHRAVAGKVA